MSEDNVTSPGDVQDDTDLTKLVGPNEKFKSLVEIKFTTEYVIVECCGVKGCGITLEEFVHDSPDGQAGVKSVLRQWIQYCGLGNRFRQPQQQQQQVRRRYNTDTCQVATGPSHMHVGSTHSAAATAAKLTVAQLLSVYFCAPPYPPNKQL